MFETALVLASLDERDAYVLDALATLAAPASVRRVLLVHVHPRPTYADPLLGGMPLDTATVAAPRGLAGLADDLRVRLPGVQVEEVHEMGRVYEAVARVAVDQRADWVLLARPPWNADDPDRNRSVLDVLRHADCTTLVVPFGSRIENDEALVGLDFSSASARALAVAIAWKRRVHPFYAYSVDPGVSAAGISPEEFAHHLERNAREHYRTLLVRQADIDPSEAPELEIAEADDPAQAILDRAPPGGMIVLGTRGLSPLATRLLGSVSEKVSERSPVPVLTVRPKGKRLGTLAALSSRS